MIITIGPIRKRDDQRGVILRQFSYFAAVFVLSSVLPALGQSTESGQLADYGFDVHRNYEPIVTFVSFAISLVIAGVFVWRSKKRAWHKAGLAICIVFFGPFVCALIYIGLCHFLNKPDGYW